MNSLTTKIGEWIRELFISGITNNFQGMFDEVNTKVTEVAAQVGQTPEGWNPGVFSMIKNLSETVIVPVAGIILTFVLCYELIHMLIDRNNLHDVDTWMFFKWIFKTLVAVYILTNTFDLVMGIFGLAQHVINGSAGVIQGTLDINFAMNDLDATLQAMGTMELMGLYMETWAISLGMKALSLCIFLIIHGRMIEIYLTVSVAPIPFSTMANHEWGQIGTNYLKALFAIAFQGFLIMVCIAIYAVLLRGVATADNIHAALWGCAGYTILLGFCLFKTSSLAKSVFSSH